MQETIQFYTWGHMDVNELEIPSNFTHVCDITVMPCVCQVQLWLDLYYYYLKVENYIGMI